MEPRSIDCPFILRSNQDTDFNHWLIILYDLHQELLLASVFPAFMCLFKFCWDLLCSSPVSRAFISEGIFPWSIAIHHCLYISSSSLRAHMALSRLDTNSSKYWYLSFFLARHSLALCRLLSSFAFKSILAGFRPRLPGFFTLPPTTLLSSIAADRPAWPGAPSPSPPRLRWPGPARPPPRGKKGIWFWLPPPLA